MAINGVSSRGAGNAALRAESSGGKSPAADAGLFTSLDDFDLTSSMLLSPMQFTMHMTSSLMQAALGKPQGGFTLSQGMDPWGGVLSADALLGRFFGSTSAGERPDVRFPGTTFYGTLKGEGGTTNANGGNITGGDFGGENVSRTREGKGKGLFNLNIGAGLLGGLLGFLTGGPIGAAVQGLSGLFGFGGGLGNGSAGDSAVGSLLRNASAGSAGGPDSEPLPARKGSSESLFGGIGKLVFGLLGKLLG